MDLREEDPRSRKILEARIILARYVFCIQFTYKGLHNGGGTFSRLSRK